MAYNKNVPNITNDIAQDLSQMQENYSRLGDLLINQTSFPANPDDGQIALVNKRLSIYDATSGLWNGLNFFGFKNRIINGDFQIWQRGTSKTGISGFTQYHTADRWKSGGNTGVLDAAQSTIDNMNSLKLTVSTPPDLSVATNFMHGFWYGFEGSHLYDLAIQGKTITLSFLFKSNVTGVYTVVLQNSTGTNKQSYVTEFTYNTANTTQKIIITIPLNTSWVDVPQNNSNLGFILLIASLAGSNYQTSTLNTWISGDFIQSVNSVNWGATAGNYIEIAQVQLEEGDTATDFEFVPYEIQLLRCMRYYCRQLYLFQGYSDAVGVIYASSSFKPNVPMRAVPTVIPNRLGNLNTDNSLFVEATAGSISPVGQNFIVRTQATGTGRTFWVGDVILDAEL